MNWPALKFEITTDPLGRGYAEMSDAQIAQSLNTANRTRERRIVPAYEIINATVPSEWASLTAQEKQRFQTITGAGDVDIKNPNVRNAMGTMFGAATGTRAALVALQNETVSRADELGLPEVHEGDVAYAKTV